MVLVIALGLGLAFAGSMLVGCEGENGNASEPPSQEKPKVEQTQGGAEAPVVPDLAGSEATYYFTFTGTPVPPTNFEMVNKTPVKEKNGHFYARKSLSFVPAQTDGKGTDLWIFDATLGSDDKLTGTATYKRSMTWTGHNGVQTWKGKVTGGLDKDLRVTGRVTGTESFKSESTNLTHPLSWSFTER